MTAKCPEQNEDPSIVIVNFNGGLQILCCLDSLRTFAHSSEVIVVDNGSTDSSVSRIAHDYPWVKLIKNNINLGFGRATNQGVSIATRPFVFILNPDTIINNGTVSGLISAYKKRNSEIILGPKLLNLDGSHQNSARSFPSHINAFFNQHSLLTKFFPNNRFSQRYLKPENIDWISGAAMFMKRSTFDKLGGFDEGFFMYCEDVDFCKRALKIGISTVLDPSIQLMHTIGGCSQSVRLNLVYERHRSMWRYYLKHNSRSVFLDVITCLGICAHGFIDSLKEVLRLRASALRRMKAGFRKALARYIVFKKSKAVKSGLKPNKILVIRNDRLGDILLTLPSIALLKIKYPKAEIHMMGQAPWRELVLSTGLVQKYITMSNSVFYQIKSFREYDLFIEFGQQGILRNAILGWLARIPIRIGYHTNYTGFFYTHAIRWDDRFRHELDNAARLLRRIGIHAKPNYIKLNEQVLETKKLSLPDSFIVIHPFASSSKELKMWPMDRFIRVANELANSGKKVVFVGTANSVEEIAVALMSSELSSGIINMIGQTDLIQLFEVISKADLVVANNSGVFQLAQSTDTPCILINGSSSLKRWGPRDSSGNRIKLVQAQDLACVSRDCPTCLRGDVACMQSISVETVYREAMSLLQ